MKQRGLEISPYLSFALLSLALSVFAWGVQAKLSLYRMVPDQATPIVAKLSTENHAIQTREAVSRIPTDTPRWEEMALRSFVAVAPIVRFSSVDRLIEPVNLRRDSPAFSEIHVLHRPPPFLG